jgi:hypothetical protein
MATIKQHDTGQRIRSTLKLNGAAYNLSGKTVSFIMKNRATGAVTKADADILSASAGTVEYVPTADDVATVGVFSCEWEVQVDVDEVLTFPHGSYEKLEIIPDLG